MLNPFRKRKPVCFDLDSYDCSSFAREVTEEELYRINGGAQVENSNEGVANAQVGDTITRNDGTTVTLNAGDIKYAQEQLGSGGGGASGGGVNGNAGDVSGGNATSPVGNPAPAGGGPSTGNSSGPECSFDFNTFSSVDGTETSPSLKDNSLDSSYSDQDTMSCNDIEINLANGGKVRLDINQVNKYVIKGKSAVGKAVDKLLWEREVAKHPNGWAAGTPFDSIEKAAQAWAKTYADDSIHDDCEYASAIYSYETDSGTKYSYNIPLQGTRKNSRANTNLEEGQILVSEIHSHGTYDPNYFDNKPSGSDYYGMLDDMGLFSGHVGKEYVVTPGGMLKSYDVNKKLITIRNDLPTDPKYIFYSSVNGSSINSAMYDYYNALVDAQTKTLWNSSFYKKDDYIPR